jgi:hypothetical protein
MVTTLVTSDAGCNAHYPNAPFWRIIYDFRLARDSLMSGFHAVVPRLNRNEQEQLCWKTT